MQQRIWHFCLFFALLFLIGIPNVGSQTFSPFSGQRIGQATNKFLEVDVLPNGTVVFNPQNNIDVTTFEGYFNDVRDYVLFSNLNSNAGNLSITLEFGTVEYFYELTLAGYISVDNGIVQLVSYDIISDTIDQISQELLLMNQNDTNPNGPINILINFGPSNNGRRRSASMTATPNSQDQSKGGHNSNRRAHGSIYNKKEVILEGAMAREIFMKSFLEHELDKQLEDMKKSEKTYRKRYVPADTENPGIDNLKQEIIPPEDFRPPEHIVLEMDQGANGRPAYRRPKHTWDKGTEHDPSLNFNFKKTKLKIPDKLKEKYINMYNEKYAEHIKQIEGDQSQGKKRAISIGGAIAADKVGDNQVFDEIGGQCKNLNGFTGLIGSKVDGCALEGIAYLGGEINALDERLTVAEGQIGDLIKFANLTQDNIDKLNQQDIIIQKQIGLIGEQIGLVFDELAKNDYRFNQLATSQALTSESIIMMSSTIKVLESQQQRAQWLTDQNFYATQQAFSGIAAQQQSALNQVNTNIEYLRLQQNANSAVQMRSIYYSIAETLVQAQTLVDQLRLEINVQADYGFETQQLINNQIQAYLNSIYFMAKNQESVIVNLFPSIRDLQRMTFGNTNLGVEYYIYKNMILQQESSSMNDGYNIVVEDGTGKPPTPINQFMILDGWTFNASWINPNATCVVSAQSSALANVQSTMASKTQMTLQVPNTLNPYMIQSTLTVNDNNVTYTFAGNLTDFSNQYFIGTFIDNVRYLLCFMGTPGYGIVVEDTPIVRSYTQSNTPSYFPPLFTFAKWRQVSYNIKTNTLTEQVVVSPLYAQKIGANSYQYYYLTVNDGCGFILKKMASINDNIDNLFVINTYTSDPQILYTNFLNQQPLIRYQGVYMMTVMPTTNYYMYYPQINNNFLWAKQNCSLNANLQNGPNVTLSAFYIDSYTTPNFVVGNINPQSEILTNVTTGGLLNQFNATSKRSTKSSRSDGDGDADEYTPSGFKLPKNWKDMIEQPSLHEKPTDGSKVYTKVETEYNHGKRGLSPVGQNQQPAAMSDCYFGIGGTDAIYYTYNSLVNGGLNNVPRFFQSGPSNADLVNQCVRKPGCSMYQTTVPSSVTFWQGNGLPVEMPIGANIFLGDTTYSGNVNQGNSMMKTTTYVVYLSNGTSVVVNGGDQGLIATSVYFICGSEAENSVINPSLESGSAIWQCVNRRQTQALMPYKNTANTPWGKDYFAFCAPYDQALLTSFNANPQFVGSFDYSVDGWGNLTTGVPNNPNCVSKTLPYSYNNKECYGVTMESRTYPLDIYMSFSGCDKYDWNGCVDPTLYGLCQQTVLIDSSTANPGGSEMSPGCGFTENDYNEYCNSWIHSAWSLKAYMLERIWSGFHISDRWCTSWWCSSVSWSR